MPTHEESAAFLNDVRPLTPGQRSRFLNALRRLIDDLRAMEAGAGSWFRPGLRVKGVQAHPGLYEMTWAPDGRATFFVGASQVSGLRHVKRERCGDHSIL